MAGVQIGEPRISRRPAARRRLVFAIAGIAVVLLAGAALIFKPWRLGKAPATAANSVVVLPCKVYAPKEDAEANAFLADAIPDCITSQLANVEGLDIRRQIAQSEFDKVRGDLKEVAARYNVERFVEPSVTVEPEQWTLKVTLYDSGTLKLLKSSKDYRGQRGGYLDLVRGISEDLRLMLRPDSKPAEPVARLAANSDAELRLREGEHLTRRWQITQKNEDFDLALSVLNRALGLDPKLADAAAGIAWLHTMRGQWADARRWAERAVGIDPKCGRAYSALSALEWNRDRPDKAKQADFALKAFRFAPRDPDTFFVLANMPMPVELSLYPTREAYQLNPLDFDNGNTTAYTLYQLGRSEEALRIVDDLLRIEPDYDWALNTKILVLADLGRSDEAEKLFMKLKGEHRELNPRLACILALERKDPEESDRLLQEILKPIREHMARPAEVTFAALEILPFLARHKKLDEALEILKCDLESSVVAIYDVLVLDPRLEPLRRDSRFKPLLEKYRENCVESMKVLAQARERGDLPHYLVKPFADLLKKLDLQL